MSSEQPRRGRDAAGEGDALERFFSCVAASSAGAEDVAMANALADVRRSVQARVEVMARTGNGVDVMGENRAAAGYRAVSRGDGGDDGGGGGGGGSSGGGRPRDGGGKFVAADLDLGVGADAGRNVSTARLQGQVCGQFAEFVLCVVGCGVEEKRFSPEEGARRVGALCLPLDFGVDVAGGTGRVDTVRAERHAATLRGFIAWLGGVPVGMDADGAGFGNAPRPNAIASIDRKLVALRVWLVQALRERSPLGGGWSGSEGGRVWRAAFEVARRAAMPVVTQLLRDVDAVRASEAAAVGRGAGSSAGIAAGGAPRRARFLSASQQAVPATAGALLRLFARVNKAKPAEVHVAALVLLQFLLIQRHSTVQNLHWRHFTVTGLGPAFSLGGALCAGAIAAAAAAAAGTAARDRAAAAARAEVLDDESAVGGLADTALARAVSGLLALSGAMPGRGTADAMGDFGQALQGLQCVSVVLERWVDSSCDEELEPDRGSARDTYSDARWRARRRRPCTRGRDAAAALAAVSRAAAVMRHVQRLLAAAAQADADAEAAPAEGGAGDVEQVAEHRGEAAAADEDGRAEIRQLLFTPRATLTASVATVNLTVLLEKRKVPTLQPLSVPISGVACASADAAAEAEAARARGGQAAVKADSYELYSTALDPVFWLACGGGARLQRDERRTRAGDAGGGAGGVGMRRAQAGTGGRSRPRSGRGGAVVSDVCLAVLLVRHAVRVEAAHAYEAGAGAAVGAKAEAHVDSERHVHRRAQARVDGASMRASHVHVARAAANSQAAQAVLVTRVALLVLGCSPSSEVWREVSGDEDSRPLQGPGGAAGGGGGGGGDGDGDGDGGGAGPAACAARFVRLGRLAAGGDAYLGKGRGVDGRGDSDDAERELEEGAQARGADETVSSHEERAAALAGLVVLHGLRVEEALAQSKLFPSLDATYVNDCLSAWSSAAGFSVPLSSHSMRAGGAVDGLVRGLAMGRSLDTTLRLVSFAAGWVDGSRARARYLKLVWSVLWSRCADVQGVDGGLGGRDASLLAGGLMASRNVPGAGVDLNRRRGLECLVFSAVGVPEPPQSRPIVYAHAYQAMGSAGTDEQQLLDSAAGTAFVDHAVSTSGQAAALAFRQAAAGLVGDGLAAAAVHAATTRNDGGRDAAALVAWSISIIAVRLLLVEGDGPLQAAQLVEVQSVAGLSCVALGAGLEAGLVPVPEAAGARLKRVLAAARSAMAMVGRASEAGDRESQQRMVADAVAGLAPFARAAELFLGAERRRRLVEVWAAAAAAELRHELLLLQHDAQGSPAEVPFGVPGAGLLSVALGRRQLLAAALAQHVRLHSLDAGAAAGDDNDACTPRALVGRVQSLGETPAAAVIGGGVARRLLVGDTARLLRVAARARLGVLGGNGFAIREAGKQALAESLKRALPVAGLFTFGETLEAELLAICMGARLPAPRGGGRESSDGTGVDGDNDSDSNGDSDGDSDGDGDGDSDGDGSAASSIGVLGRHPWTAQLMLNSSCGSVARRGGGVNGKGRGVRSSWTADETVAMSKLYVWVCSAQPADACSVLSFLTRGRSSSQRPGSEPGPAKQRRPGKWPFVAAALQCVRAEPSSASAFPPRAAGHVSRRADNLVQRLFGGRELAGLRAVDVDNAAARHAILMILSTLHLGALGGLSDGTELGVSFQPVLLNGLPVVARDVWVLAAPRSAPGGGGFAPSAVQGAAEAVLALVDGRLGVVDAVRHAASAGRRAAAQRRVVRMRNGAFATAGAHTRAVVRATGAGPPPPGSVSAVGQVPRAGRGDEAADRGRGAGVVRRQPRADPAKGAGTPPSRRHQRRRLRKGGSASVRRRLPLQQKKGASVSLLRHGQLPQQAVVQPPRPSPPAAAAAETVASAVTGRTDSTIVRNIKRLRQRGAAHVAAIANVAADVNLDTSDESSSDVSSTLGSSKRRRM